MNTSTKTAISKDTAGKKVKVSRTFDAPVAKVWEAWTNSAILDQWWAPKPWKAETKSMDFKEGGHWLYAMVSPEGERHWARVDYETIDAPNEFTAMDSFCDDNGIKVTDPPGMHWSNVFNEKDGITTVEVAIVFATENDMAKILEMGFEEGFASGLDNLEEWLADH